MMQLSFLVTVSCWNQQNKLKGREPRDWVSVLPRVRELFSVLQLQRWASSEKEGPATNSRGLSGPCATLGIFHP